MTGQMKPWLFWLSVYTFRIFCSVYFRGQRSGRRNYPKKGPFIIAMNHNSLMDIPAMAYAVDRPLYTMAKESLFKIPVLGWWMHGVGFFPVRRGAGDRQAMEFARKVLAEGGVLTMAPEGTRRRRGEGKPKAHTGFVRLAQEFKCPVIPVGVQGARKILPPDAVIPRPFKLRVQIGQPVYLEEVEVNPKNQDILQQQADDIMEQVYQLCGEDYTQ